MVDEVRAEQAGPPGSARRREIDSDLDTLIPAPLGSSKKLVVGAVLLSLAVGATVLNLGGYVVPKPFVGTSFSSGGALQLDQERGLLGARVLFPNNSQRSVRITKVAFDAPGAELVDVGVGFEPRLKNDEATDRATFSEPAEIESIAGDTGELQSLPVTIHPGDRANLFLWFRPLDCTVADGPPWGIAEATFDFGAGAFPGMSKTERISEDPVWEGEPDVWVTGFASVSAADPLAAACDVLR